MNKKSDFYITLISSGCMKRYPNNTKSDFVNDLENTKNLNSNYEVALVQAILPSTLNYITLKEGGFIITRNEFGLKSITSITKKVKLVELMNNDDMLDKPIDNLNKIISSTLKEEFGTIGDEFLIQYDKENKVYSITHTFPYMSISFFGNICDIFNFYSTKEIGHIGKKFTKIVSKPTKEILFSDFSKISDKKPTIMFYCDILQYQNVGGELLKLLSVQKLEEVININNPIYIPINTFSLDSIRISIKDDTDSPIHFISDENKTFITIHFRPIKYE
ncbi:MAG: hypothetical protein KDC90_14050 [Ignavibacteriae bacterium]|nr:hypothetical protein [Ignavibacteriota bacterium]